MSEKPKDDIILQPNDSVLVLADPSLDDVSAMKLALEKALKDASSKQQLDVEDQTDGEERTQ